MPRNGTKNLIPFNKLTEEEQKKISRNGGIKSGESRRQKKLLKETLEEYLSITSSDGKTYQDEITLSLIKAALDKNPKAYEVIRDTIGQKPTEKLEAQIDMPVFQNDIDE